MPLLAVFVTVTAAERKALKKRIRGTRTAWRDRLRAQIVLAAAMGRSTARIARDLRISQDTVRKWRGRFADRGLEGLVICRGLGGRGHQRGGTGGGGGTGLPAAGRYRGAAGALDRPGAGR